MCGWWPGQYLGHWGTSTPVSPPRPRMCLQTHAFIQLLVLVVFPRAWPWVLSHRLGHRSSRQCPQYHRDKRWPLHQEWLYHRVLTDGILVPACGDRHPTEPFLCHPRNSTQLSGTLIFLNDGIGQVILIGKVNMAGTNNACSVPQLPGGSEGRVSSR